MEFSALSARTGDDEFRATADGVIARLHALYPEQARCRSSPPRRRRHGTTDLMRADMVGSCPGAVPVSQRAS